MATIGINYKYENMIYESVYLYTLTKELIFNSGNFIKDWYDAKKKYIDIMDEEINLSQSSTVDHFIMDGAPYSSAYLHFEDNKYILKYLEDEENMDIFEYRNIFERGWEFFVPLDSKPTWEEFKQLIK